MFARGFPSGLIPLFTLPSKTDLLERCLEGHMQNANESVNAIVWTRAPKHRFRELTGIKTAACAAVCVFNGAVSKTNHLCQQMNLTEAEHTVPAL